ncbi:MAG TPA: NAD(P) transhydrogenase subunit alpha [Polyangia bacterium]|nr:NAD(P) transhydrogenase subunit alpha [Polyangia bacterium]
MSSPSIRIAVAKEASMGETRVALVADGVKRLVGKGWSVSVQSGAGDTAGVSDSDYIAAGATIEASAKALFATVDVILQIRPPTKEQLELVKAGTTIVCGLNALGDPAAVADLAARKVDAVAVELIPRSTVAQMMDVLSSQATVAGYRAVLLAAEASPRLYPMLMTAAGTIAPATVLVLGAGVAGLQAIATARRLGAVVEAFDARKTVKEQVESLGARFVEVPSDEDAQTAGGYAKEMSEEYKARQRALLAERIAKCDACITTAQIPGQRAPILITQEMVRGMKRGSVIIDLAAEQGGNCALTRPGKRLTVDGVTIVGDLNLPGSVAFTSSQMYSRNMERLLVHLYRSGALDGADDITRAVLVSRGGQVANERVRTLVQQLQADARQVAAAAQGGA